MILSGEEQSMVDESLREARQCYIDDLMMDEGYELAEAERIADEFYSKRILVQQNDDDCPF